MIELLRPRNLLPAFRRGRQRNALSKGAIVNARFIDWIWTIRGSLPLPPEQSSDEAFDRLDPLFRKRGTSRERTGSTLTFRKQNQAPQDKMAIFDDGILQIEKGVAGAVLHYRLTSRALLFCFLAPLLFLSVAGLTVAIGNMQTPSTEAASKKPEKKTELPQHSIDKLLGAPAPEKPKKDGDKPKADNKKPSPTAAYVFAAIFAALYAVGRILEDRLVRTLFKKSARGMGT